jgi:hypothetical protein
MGPQSTLAPEALFLVLAVLGSLACVYGTLGRTSAAGDGERAKRQDALQALADARLGAKQECTKIGPRCQQWLARIDSLKGAGAVDPRSETVAQLATLVGLDGHSAKALTVAVEPLLLPLFLEFGSICFFAAAFSKRRNSKQLLTVAPNPEETVTVSFTRDMALRDFRSLKDAPAQQFLAQRWGVDKSTVSR